MNKYYIYPAIGIARVGNSESDFLLTPDLPYLPVEPNFKYKDDEGKVKPHAARFRIYEVDDKGKVLQEVVADKSTEINWRVHLANRKSINYTFQNAMDLGKLSKDCPLRNPHITDLEERKTKLLLDPGTRFIQGISRDQSNAEVDEDFVFGSAKFYEGTSYQQDVYLGQLRTDEKGRLLVLGGRGKSASFDGKPAITFANNNGWHDDVSDGTVRATLTINGTQVEAEPAMVAVTPPNFAPGIEGTVTMLDVVEDLFEKEKLINPVTEVDFYRDLYPIFKSLVDNQAVNSGFYFAFGENSPGDFTSKDLLQKISSNSEENKAVREFIFKQFRPSVAVTNQNREDLLKKLAKERDIENKGLALELGSIANEAILSSQQEIQADQLPPFYGDAYGDYYDNPLANLSLTDRQYEMLERWSIGDFVTGEPSKTTSLEDLDLQDQPKSLSKGQLAQCLGGPFHPGIELTWFLRLASMWNTADTFDPMRLNILAENEKVRDFYGKILTPEVALAEMFNASGPGTLTRFMGVPWQTDEASCRSGQDYDPAYYLPLASFWSARVPNQVLSSKGLERLNDPDLPNLQRLKHLDYRQDWLRFFPHTTYQTEINGMVQDWDKIGIVSKQKLDNPLKIDGFELDSLWVESEVNKKFTINDPTFRMLVHMEALANAEGKVEVPNPEKGKYAERLRQLEQDDLAFAQSPTTERKRYTRQERFGSEDS
ncbi:LodA/GoxA family CTQ-dependent oxidase [Reichenbachiella versicolor]|uniref:LodA/GoxA family CTQ-dependent oxidase n=1 Tax=Reichenbachiella versicolor TaxID=1821036 RepID=UPI000D6E11DD|nr:LodA/GoxA family CTQ-dependent oxidase [Reichenbachiella versicolor]